MGTADPIYPVSVKIRAFEGRQGAGNMADGKSAVFCQTTTIPQLPSGQ